MRREVIRAAPDRPTGVLDVHLGQQLGGTVRLQVQVAIAAVHLFGDDRRQRMGLCARRIHGHAVTNTRVSGGRSTGHGLQLPCGSAACRSRSIAARLCLRQRLFAGLCLTGFFGAASIV